MYMLPFVRCVPQSEISYCVNSYGIEIPVLKHPTTLERLPSSAGRDAVLLTKFSFLFEDDISPKLFSQSELPLLSCLDRD